MKPAAFNNQANTDPAADLFGSILKRLALLIGLLGLLLAVTVILGLMIGSSLRLDGWRLDRFFNVLLGRDQQSVAAAILWQIRLPRVILAATVGASLALGGLVFQALLRNPLAEPYILGVSGGSAIGAIIGILLGVSAFPGVPLTAFAGSMAVLAFILVLATGTRWRPAMSSEALLLGGVMMNAFCGAIIMFLISISRSSQVHHILFWLMGDLSIFGRDQLPTLLSVLPLFLVVFLLARPMNLLLMGREAAAAMGVNVRLVSLVLLVTTSLLVSLVVSQSGLVGFVGLVIPHIFRQLVGPDHRLLIPACILGGASYMVLCDLLARILPAAGEMPVGIVTALIGAPLFILLLWRSRQ